MVTIEGEEIKRKLLANPKRILSMAKKMGTDVGKAEELFDDLTNEPFSLGEWLDKLEEMLDLAVIAIIDSLRVEFGKQNLGDVDVEKHFLRAMMDLKRCTPESIRRAQESIKKARSEAKRLEKVKKEAVDTVLEIQAILRGSKELGKAWSLRGDYLEMEESVEEIFDALNAGNYELALHMGKSTLEGAKELRDIKPIAIRYAAKAGHVVRRLGADGSSVPEEELKRLSNLLITIRGLLEGEDYKTALLLAKETKRETEKFLPSDKARINTFVCPICFDIKCPNAYCNMSISPSPLIEETCRTYCSCGTLYHICCVQKGENLTCVNCYKPLQG